MCSFVACQETNSWLGYTHVRSVMSHIARWQHGPDGDTACPAPRAGSRGGKAPRSDRELGCRVGHWAGQDFRESFFEICGTVASEDRESRAKKFRSARPPATASDASRVFSLRSTSTVVPFDYVSHVPVVVKMPGVRKNELCGVHYIHINTGHPDAFIQYPWAGSEPGVGSPGRTGSSVHTERYVRTVRYRYRYIYFLLI